MATHVMPCTSGNCGLPVGQAAVNSPRQRLASKPLALQPALRGSPEGQVGQVCSTMAVVPSMRPGLAGKPTATQPPAAARSPRVSSLLPLPADAHSTGGGKQGEVS